MENYNRSENGRIQKSANVLETDREILFNWICLICIFEWIKSAQTFVCIKDCEPMSSVNFTHF